MPKSPDETMHTYFERLQSSPNYAGRRDFLSNTTWLPSSTAGFRIGNSQLMKPMQISVVGQISDSESNLDPFADMITWSLPNNFADRLCTFTITEPSDSTLPASFRVGFLRAICNLCHLSETQSFPLFGQATHDVNCLDVTQLYNNRIVLQFPFFKRKPMAISTPSSESSDDVDNLIIAAVDPRLTSLIFDASVTHTFLKLPIFSSSGQQLLLTQLRDIAGSLVEFTFTIKMPRTSTGKIVFLLTSLHVIN